MYIKQNIDTSQRLKLSNFMYENISNKEVPTQWQSLLEKAGLYVDSYHDNSRSSEPTSMINTDVSDK